MAESKAPRQSASYIVEIPVEDFLEIVHLVEAALNRNSDLRIKGFYMKLLENLQAGWKANVESPSGPRSINPTS
jgi:hypothetical protein